MRVDAQEVMHGRGQILRRDGMRGRIRSRAVEDQGHAAANAAAGEDDGEAMGPMIPAAVGVKARRSAEFAHHHDQGFVEQSAFGEIFDWVEKAASVGGWSSSRDQAR